MPSGKLKTHFPGSSKIDLTMALTIGEQPSVDMVISSSPLSGGPLTDAGSQLGTTFQDPVHAVQVPNLAAVLVTVDVYGINVKA
jgi:hypothetical protein